MTAGTFDQTAHFLDRVSAHPLRYVIRIAAAILALMLLSGSYFTVGPSDRAYVVRFGGVTTAIPYAPGFHFKMPFIDRVDHLKVAKDTLTTPEVQFFTKDTQWVKISLGVTYDVPDEAVYNLLYQTGSAGSNSSVDANITRILVDRTRSIISKYAITEVAGADRETVLAAVKQVIGDEAKQVFGIHVVDVQIPVFQPSDVFMHGVEQAVLIRNQQLQSQLQRDKARVDAETLQIQTTAQATAVIEQARGVKEATIHAAEASATKIELEGRGAAAARLAQAESEARGVELRGAADASAIGAKIKAAGGADFYVRQLQAEAMLKWNGSVPQMTFGAGGSAPVLPMMQVPVPALTQPSK